MTIISTESKVKGYDFKYTLYNDKARTIKAIRYAKPIYTKESKQDSKPVKKDSKPRKKTDLKSRQDNLNRSKNMMLDYIKENESKWQSFITLTFADNVTDIDTANRIFANWVRQVKRVYPDLAYCGTIEAQKRGALHYHLLTNIRCDSAIIPKQEIKRIWKPEIKKWIELEYYDLKYWNDGYSSAFDIIANTDDNFKVHLYLAKYIAKGDNEFLCGRKKLLKSNNLQKPREYKVSENSQIHEELVELIAQHKILVKEKHILSPNQYAPSTSIYQFTDKV